MISYNIWLLRKLFVRSDSSWGNLFGIFNRKMNGKWPLIRYSKSFHIECTCLKCVSFCYKNPLFYQILFTRYHVIDFYIQSDQFFWMDQQRNGQLFSKQLHINLTTIFLSLLIVFSHSNIGCNVNYIKLKKKYSVTYEYIYTEVSVEYSWKVFYHNTKLLIDKQFYFHFWVNSRLCDYTMKVFKFRIWFSQTRHSKITE